MDMEMIQIDPTRALVQANSLISNADEIRVFMEELNAQINKIIPDGINLDWAVELKEDWVRYYNADIAQALVDIKNSADTIKQTSEMMIAYNRQG